MGRRGQIKSYCFVVIILVIWKPSDGATMENAKERVNLVADEVKGKASESTQDAKDMSDSWADWAIEKLAGFGIGMDNNGDEAMHKARDIAVKTKDQVSDMASGAADKAGEAKDAMMDKAAGYREIIKDKASQASGSSSVDNVESRYEEAKQKVDEAYQTAKDTMSEGAKKNYEAAKEKASQATGDFGAHISHGAEEL